MNDEETSICKPGALTPAKMIHVHETLGPHTIPSIQLLEFTDLGDVHDFDGRQLSRLNMSPLEKNTRETSVLEMSYSDGSVVSQANDSVIKAQCGESQSEPEPSGLQCV